MFDRLWWFLTGIVTGAAITIRALQRRPRPRDVRSAALATGADVLGLAARIVEPRTRRMRRAG